MKLIKRPRYERTVKKILKAHKLDKDIIIQTEDMFIENPKEPSLRYHKIICKKDKHRWSITVPNTQYRILITQIEETAYFVALLNHREYDKNNKDC